jgi:drug/metabolite transporter (DMT)-like permease
MKFRVSRLDALLVIMTIIWGSNYSIIKSALREIPAAGFNGLRLLIASALFLLAIAIRKDGASAPLTRRDWWIIAALGFVGHFVYQILFMSGLSHTSVANSALIIGCTPIFVALLTAALGLERTTPARWAGVLVSAFGIYLVVGRGAAVSGQTLAGDLTMLGAVLCWAVSTVAARPILARHSPLVVTGYSMAIGTVLYLPGSWRDLQRTAWASVSASTWAALVFSSTCALCIAYMIWYTAVQRLGNTRTSAYSNVVPIAAMIVAWAWLGEPIGALKLAGAAAIICGVALTRLGGSVDTAPIEHG